MPFHFTVFEYHECVLGDRNGKQIQFDTTAIRTYQKITEAQHTSHSNTRQISHNDSNKGPLGNL